MATAQNLCRKKVLTTIFPVGLRNDRRQYEGITFYLPFHSVCAFVNVLSLIFSAPFVACDNDDYIEGSGSGDLENDSGRCDRLFVWFVVITCIDFIVSIVYTLQLIARVECAIYLRIHKDRVSVVIPLPSMSLILCVHVFSAAIRARRIQLCSIHHMDSSAKPNYSHIQSVVVSGSWGELTLSINPKFHFHNLFFR